MVSVLPSLPDSPAVSYVMPVLNEEDYLEAAVRTILEQDYAGEKEIVLALGPSCDRSNEIAARLAAEDRRVQLVGNPERSIPAGLNRAIEASRHPVVVRVDAHSELTPDYTSRGVTALREAGAANAGGIMQAAGSGPVQRAIARGYNSPFGLGGGAYHGDGTPGAAESAYLGIFRREAIEEAGGYDPEILRGEDWELNLRIRRNGGLVWFDPSLRVTYWPRASFGDLGKQFFATGIWRAVLVRRYGGANPWRFFAPGTLVLALAASLLIAAVQLVGSLSAIGTLPTDAAVPWASWWSMLHLAPALYAIGIAYAALIMPDQRSFGDRVLSARVLVTMHLSWGAGFLRGIVFGGGRSVDRSRA